MGLSGYQNQTSWHLAERVSLCIAAVYCDTFGSLDALAVEVVAQRPIKLSPETLVAQLAEADLPRFNRIAIQQLAADGNRKSGRHPLKHPDWNIILYSLSGATTLRESINRCIECFEAIDWRCGKMQLRVQGNRAHLSLDAMRLPRNLPAYCLVDLFGLTEIHDLFGWLIGVPIPANAVMLDHSAELFASLALPPLPFAIEFDDGWTGFTFDVAYLDYPIIRSADELKARPRRSFLFAGTAQTAPKSASERVREIALRSLKDRQRLPRFDEILATMTQSEATLRRRLANEGTSYRQLRESCRRELAFDMLIRTTLSVEEIAARLDFCNSDALRQAFRNWAQTTPSEYRKQAQLQKGAILVDSITYAGPVEPVPSGVLSARWS